MALTHVKGAANASGATGGTGGITFTATSTSAVTFTYTASGTGDLVLFWINGGPGITPTGTPVFSVSATGWMFTQVGGVNNGGKTSGMQAIFWASAPNTSAASITVTISGLSNPDVIFWNVNASEWSGMDTTNPIDNSNIAVGSGTPTVSLTPVNNNCAIWVACDDSVTAVGTIGGVTATKSSDDGAQDWAEYLVLGGGGGTPVTCTLTGSGTYGIGAVSIAPASTGPIIGSVPSGIALATPAFTAKFLFFDTGDFSTGV